MRHTSRPRVAFAVLIGLMVFLLGSLYHEVKAKDRALAHLTAVNRTVVDKLAEVLAHTIRAETAAETAGQTPTVRVEDVLSQIKGVDQALINEALQKAYATVAKGETGATGARGPAGPPGPAATTSSAPSTPTTGPGGTSTTAHPATSTTTTSESTPTSTSTSTTRPCALGLLGLCLAR